MTQPALGLDPIHSTFAGGVEEPLHNWFPYLEGFSPDFVRAILERYCGSAGAVLDPFSGTGTTAFAAAEVGRQAYVCEVNPVLQFVFSSKVAARTIDVDERYRVASRLDSVAAELKRLLLEADLHPVPQQSYTAAFGDKKYFPSATFELLLRARSLAEELVEDDEILGRLFLLACLASLIPVSLLKRAGDLRYMTAAEQQKAPPKGLVEVLTARLRQIERDLKHVKSLKTAPILVCENARSLTKVPPLGLSAIVTSPPYVNGTNYFRNTKLELWFLGHIRRSDDLKYYRERSLTAGINNVSRKSLGADPLPAVQDLVELLEETAYDPRIPRMVGAYFHELRNIFRGAAPHLKANALVAIDIGDSIYGGVHVPADDLLTEVLRDLDYRHEESVLLRVRHSNDGTPLRQSLLIFRPPSHQRSRRREPTSPPVEWERFKDELPHQNDPFSKRNWGNPAHSLCSYPGKLKPAIAHHLIKAVVPSGGTLFDPFAGVGTLPFEGALMGRRGLGIDLSPAAFTVAAAKMGLPEATQTNDLIAELEEEINRHEPSQAAIKEAEQFGFNGRIVEYYHPKTLREILAARRFFLDRHESEDPSLLLLKAASLHILHGNRPYALSRRSHPLTPYRPTGESEYRPLIPRLKDKVERTLAVDLGSEYMPGKIFNQDATAPWPHAVDHLDAIITSPPFLNSTRFHTQNWLRLWFAGWGPRDFRDKTGAFVEERQRASFDIYAEIFRQARERLKLSGLFVLHLGKSNKADMAEQLRRVAAPWFARAEVLDESVAHCESHGMRDKGTVTSHQYLLLS